MLSDLNNQVSLFIIQVMEQQLHSDTARCKRCDQIKPQTDFYRNRTTKSGWQFYCKDCSNETHTDWVTRNREVKKSIALRYYNRNKAKIAAYNAARHAQFPELKYAALAARRAKSPKRAWAKSSVMNARHRAKKLGVPFTITVEFIASIAPDLCPVLGMPLAYPNGVCRDKHGGSPNSPTIDRLDNKLGYVENNVAVISLRANSIKTDATYSEIQAVADWVKSCSAHK